MTGATRPLMRPVLDSGAHPRSDTGAGDAGRRGGDAVTTETMAPPVSREVLEDRYTGLVDEPNGDPSKVQFRLWKSYEQILHGVTRKAFREPGDSWAPGVDLIAELDALLREHIVRRVEELGIARTGRD